MNIPGTGGQLLIVLLFVIPGAVYQATRSRLRGPSPADQDATSRILRDLGQRVLNALYLALVGPQLGRLLADLAGAGDLNAALRHARAAGWVALLLLFVVPVALATLDYWRTRWDLTAWRARLPWLPELRLAYDPTPRAWDFAFTGCAPGLVRVLTGDGRWVGGWYGPHSFAASYPEPLELYLEDAPEKILCPAPTLLAAWV